MTCYSCLKIKSGKKRVCVECRSLGITTASVRGEVIKRKAYRWIKINQPKE